MAANIEKAMVHIEKIVQAEFTKGFAQGNRNFRHYQGLVRVDAHRGNNFTNVHTIHLPGSLPIAVKVVTQSIRDQLDAALRIFGHQLFYIEINKDGEHLRSPEQALILKLQVDFKEAVSVVCVGNKPADYTPHAGVVVRPVDKIATGKRRGPKPRKGPVDSKVVDGEVQIVPTLDSNGLNLEALRAVWGNEPVFEPCIQALIEKGLTDKNALLKALGSDRPTRAEWQDFIDKLKNGNDEANKYVWADFRRDFHWYLLRVQWLQPFVTGPLAADQPATEV